MASILPSENPEKDIVGENNNENSLQACKVSKKEKQAFKLQNLGTRIPRDVLIRFRQLVLYKNGKINGYFAQEVTKALEFWMNNQQQTSSFANSSFNSGRPRSDKKEKLRLIAMNLKQLNSYPHVNHLTLVHCIESSLGPCDKRTSKGYLDYIKKHSKETIANSWERPTIDVSKFVEKIQRDE